MVIDMGERMDRPGCLVRRRIVTASLAAAATLVLAVPASAQKKVTKSEAQYQDHPQDIQMCSTCTLFVKPNGCKVVEGDIDPDGWCRLFDMVD
jgi:hypothetical protein